jgi:glycerol-3-phosphate dehydrogenase
LDDPAKKNVIIPSGGSHLILPKQYSGKKWGYLVPKTSDGRVLFILPWMGKTLVGTTDKKFNEPV